MKNGVALLLVLHLQACGGGDIKPDNHGYGSSFDVQGASGLRLRYSPTVAANTESAKVAFYETAFLNVEKCSGLSAPAPFDIIVPFGSLPDGKTGYYLSDPSLILLADASLFEHESIHYLLDVSTGDLDPGHRSALFTTCSSAPF